jgi:hypothetical protein
MCSAMVRKEMSPEVVGISMQSNGRSFKCWVFCIVHTLGTQFWCQRVKHAAPRFVMAPSYRNVDWIKSGQMAGTCEYCNEPSAPRSTEYS